MDLKRLVTGTVVGAVVLNVVGFLLWGLLLVDFFAAHQGSAMGVEKDPPVMWAIWLGSVLTAALVTMVLDWSGSTSVAHGFKTGVIFGLLMAGGVDFLFYGFTNLFDMTGVLVDIALAGIQFGLTGLAIAAVGGMMGGGTAAADTGGAGGEA